ncbi:MAG: hypothetical protein GF333_05085 [Candidatus Omnitrophica bacterium]|nr:hypothetical protein [Candidatus Omnitrophota bacterium]
MFLHARRNPRYHGVNMGWFGLSGKEKAIWRAIKPGDKVTIMLGDEAQEKYETKVCDVNPYYVYVDTPEIDRALLDVVQNTPVKLEIEVFNPETGKIRFASKVLGQEWFKKQRIQVSRPRKIEWVQLRRHRRVPTALTAEFSFVEDDSTRHLNLSSESFTAKVQNVSEGGALLVIEKLMSVETGAQVNLKITLSPEYTVRARGKIVRIEASEGKYGLGIDFLRIGEKDKELLRKYISVNVKRF